MSPRCDDNDMRHSRSNLVLIATLAAFWLLAYRALWDFDPDAGVKDAVRGVEGWLFSPSGKSPTFIFGVAIVLLARRRDAFVAALSAATPCLQLALPLLGGAALLHAWGNHTGAPDILVLSMIALIQGGAALLAGRAGARVLLLPSLFLLLAIPAPAVWINHVVYPLQLATAQASAQLLRTIGGVAAVHGDLIVTPTQIFQVIESCSGITFLETLTMSAVLYGELFYRSRTQFWILLLSAPAISFVANQFRVLSIMLNPYSALSGVHTAQGIIVLVVGVFSLALLDWLLYRLLPTPPVMSEDAPITRKPFDARALPRPRLIALVLGVAALGVLTFTLPTWQPGPRAGRPLADFPLVLRGWNSKSTDVDRQFLGSVRFTERMSRVFASPDGAAEVAIFVGIDEHVQRNFSLISRKTALPGPGSVTEDRGTATFDGDDRTASRLRVDRMGRKVLIYHWYEGVAPLPAEVARSFLALDRSPWRRQRRATVVRLSTPLSRGSTEATASARLEAFVPLVREALAALENGTWNRDLRIKLADPVARPIESAGR